MKVIITAFSLLILNIIFYLMWAYPVMYMWNWALVPAVTFAHPITWMQSFVIMLMIHIIFRAITAEIK